MRMLSFWQWASRHCSSARHCSWPTQSCSLGGRGGEHCIPVLHCLCFTFVCAKTAATTV